MTEQRFSDLREFLGGYQAGQCWYSQSAGCGPEHFVQNVTQRSFQRIVPRGGLRGSSCCAGADLKGEAAYSVVAMRYCCLAYPLKCN